MKSLYDISLQITEDEYRKDKALSYSTLARYEREGFNNLNKLFDKIETSSLTFGSAVDSIITGGQKEFDERFMVADFPSTPDSIIKIVKVLFRQYNEVYRSLDKIPNDLIIRETEVQSYQLNWKPETRAKVIKEKGMEYYNLLFLASFRNVMDVSTYNDVCNAVQALKESETTKFYFAPDNPFDNIERQYQLKFKATFNNVDYRCMMDLCVVNHDKKIIIPCDLKTSNHTEWDFNSSFTQWLYMIQSRLYARILKANVEKDDYFKDFTILPYIFIVVNRKTLTPLTWEYEDTFSYGTLKYGKYGQYICRDPFEIGEELKGYLDNTPKVPKGIYLDRPNSLKEWLNKL